jgi:hypothetical protein
MVTTVIGRLRKDSEAADLADRVGGSTYTVSIWPGHPFADEVYATLGRLRSELSDLRERVSKVNQEQGVPDEHTRVVIYLGQCLTNEQNGTPDHQE